MEHRDITGVNNHEPKGVEDATSGEVYVADGAGSGTWQSLDIPTGIFVADTKTFTASGTWNKPSDLFSIHVKVQAEGGSTFGAGGHQAIFGSGADAFKFGSAGGKPNSGTVAGSDGQGADVGTPDFSLDGEANFTLTDSGTDTIDRPGLGAGPFGHIKGKGNPGGGGGYSEKWIAASDLPSSVTVTIGANAAANGMIIVEEYVLA